MKCLFSLLLAVTILCPASAECGDGLSIGPIRIGMREEEVLRLLDKPRSTEASDGFVQRVHSFDGLVVEFDEDLRVAGIESTTHQYCFDGWLCPGVDFSGAFAKAKRVNAKTKATKGKLTIPGDGCWTVAEAGASGLVKRVLVQCEP